jgi:hypothetical protein
MMGLLAERPLLLPQCWPAKKYYHAGAQKQEVRVLIGLTAA